MSLLSFSKYAIQSIYRNKRRTFAAIIGVLLAVTLVAGENVAIDTTTSSVFKQMMDTVTYDFVGTSSSNLEIENATRDLANVPNVEIVEPIVELGTVYITEWGYNGTQNATFAMLRAISSDFGRVSAKFGIKSDPSVPRGQIVVTDEIATHAEVSPGDQVTLAYELIVGPLPEYRYLNFTVAKIVQVEPLEGGDIFLFGPYLWFDISILVNLEDLELLISGFGLEDLGPNFLYSSYYVWVDRDELVKAGDPSKTDELLERMRRDLNDAGYQYGILFEESPISFVVMGFGIYILMYRALFLALALPAIVLGVYLGIIGAELGLSERRREIGILKARGANRRQVFGLLLIEAFILGIIVGIGGLILGALSSNLFSIASPYGVAPSVLELTITEFTIVLAIVLAIALLIFSAYRPAKRASTITVTEALHKYSKEEAAVKYKPLRDIIFIALAIFTYTILILLKYFTEQGSPLMFALCLLTPLLMVLTPLSPFFLVIGVTSFLTRFSTKIYDWTSRAAKPFTKDLYEIVNRNIVRNPKRASNVCVLIAMALSFGILVSSTGESQSAYMERSLEAQIGSDLKLWASPVNRSFASQIRDAEGVEGVAESAALSAIIGYERFPVSLHALNSSAYWQVAHPDSYYFKEGDPQSAISRLGTYGNVIVSEKLAETHYLRVNDDFSAEVTNAYHDPNGTWHSDTDDYRFTVVGIVKVLPGFMGADIGMFSEGEMYVDFISLNETSFGNQSFSYIVNVRDGSDSVAVGENLQNANPDEILEFASFEEELEKAKSDPFTGALFNFLLVEVAFALLIIGIGLGLIMFVAATEREGEFASIMSRGASSKQVARLLLGESVTIIIIGTVIGIVTGLLTGFIFNDLLSYAMVGLGQGVLDMPYVVSFQTLILIVVTIVILIVASLLATLKIRRMKLAQALRKRGG